MTMIEVQFNEYTLAQIQREASRQQASLETLIQELIERLATIKVGETTLLGLVAQDSGFMQSLATVALAERESGQALTNVDPILALGTDPITLDITDASDNHDAYLYAL